LLPREQVRRYYLAALKEAGEEGFVRPPHETPLEYAEDLAAELPESEGDARELTEAFIDARYSRREIGSGEVAGAESAWRRLVRGLRGDQRRGR
jgi:predicted ATPase